MAETRAEQILGRMSEIAPFIISAGLGVTGAGIHAASNIWQAKRRTREKIQQAGLGGEHQQAKQQLSTLRRQHYLGLHTPGNAAAIKQKYLAQKQRVKNIETQGLHQYHASLAQNPVEHATMKRQELLTHQ
jgi:hypothetical protein